jgi:RND family efflux transporter MFP subunit
MRNSPFEPFFKVALLSSAFVSCLVMAQQPTARIVQVTQVVRAEVTPTVSVPGTIYSRNEVQITAGIGGQLEMVAEPGTIIRKGDVVSRISRSTLMLQRAEQEALLERAEINLRQLDSQLRRQRELQGSNLVSEFELEQTEANRDLAKSDANITRVRIRQIDEQIERSETRANFSGVVIERVRREGEEVARGEMLARLTDLDNLEVRAYVPLKHLQRTVAGDSITVHRSDVSIEGRIRALVPTGDIRSQTFEAIINLPEHATGQWAVGQLVSVAVPIRSGEPALTVHRDALILRQGGQFVYRINDQNRAERIPVETGDSQGELIAVAGELNEGDSIAVRGAESLSDGAEVRILIPETASISAPADEA